MKYEKEMDYIYDSLKALVSFLGKLTGLTDFYQRKKEIWKEEDEAFLTETQSAHLDSTHPLAHVTLRLVAVVMLSLLLWSSCSTIDEVTVGMGEVVPSTHIHKIQNLEGGILAELAVKEGDIVEKGDILMRIDNTIFDAQYRESTKRREGLEITITRLQAEMDGEPLEFSQETKVKHPDLVSRESELYSSRKDTMEDSLHSLRENLSQLRKEYWDNLSALTRLYAEAKKEELSFSEDLLNYSPEIVDRERNFYQTRKQHVESRMDYLKRARELASREYEMNKELMESGATSEVEVLRLERELNQIDSELHNTLNDFILTAATEARSRQTDSLRLEREISDLEGEIENQLNNFHMSVVEEHKENLAGLNSLKEQMVALKDRVSRTVVNSPVYGTVNRVHIQTVGGVIQPGMDLIEIVPLDDTLLVEAKIRPSDIAFLHPGQKVTVKLTAYDFSIYGGLDGILEHISSDTHSDEQGNEFYKIRVRTHKNYLGSAYDPLPIIPGMTSTTDILTGKKTILSYLIKPLNKARQKAMRER